MKRTVLLAALFLSTAGAVVWACKLKNFTGNTFVYTLDIAWRNKVKGLGKNNIDLGESLGIFFPTPDSFQVSYYGPGDGAPEPPFVGSYEKKPGAKKAKLELDAASITNLEEMTEDQLEAGFAALGQTVVYDLTVVKNTLRFGVKFSFKKNTGSGRLASKTSFAGTATVMEAFLGEQPTPVNTKAKKRFKGVSENVPPGNFCFNP